MSRRTNLPILGVVSHHYLRETGLVQMRQDVRLAIFAPLKSNLHRLADYSFPLPALEDFESSVLEKTVRSAELRGVHLNGMISFRDLNVPMVAEVTNRRQLPGPQLHSLEPIKRKSSFRIFANQHLPATLHTPVAFEVLSPNTSKRSFEHIVSRLLKKHGPVIVKPDRGSCSYHITSVHSVGDLNDAWERFERGKDFRGGDFIVEQKLFGREFAVETVIDERIRDMRITQYTEPQPDLHHETGHFVPDEFSEKERSKIFRLTTEIHNALRLKNMITHLEMIQPRESLPGIVELNPRLAGDLTQELHRLTTGIEYYRIAARIATGQNVPKAFFGNGKGHLCSLIKFSPPGKGDFAVDEWPITELKCADDRCGLIGLEDDGPGDTNDDRPGYVLLVGKNRIELEKRAVKMLQRIRPSVGRQ